MIFRQSATSKQETEKLLLRANDQLIQIRTVDVSASEIPQGTVADFKVATTKVLANLCESEPRSRRWTGLGEKFVFNKTDFRCLTLPLALHRSQVGLPVVCSWREDQGGAMHSHTHPTHHTAEAVEHGNGQTDASVVLWDTNSWKLHRRNQSGDYTGPSHYTSAGFAEEPKDKIII